MEMVGKADFKDQERLDAEATALGLQRCLSKSEAFDVTRAKSALSGLPDLALAKELRRLRLLELQAKSESRLTSAWRATMATLASRYSAEFGQELDRDELKDMLESKFSLSVGDDGLLEATRINSELDWVGELEFALYHHTSSALLPAFERDGLKAGRQTNFFNTQAGVYVSTIAAGEPVSIYSSRAALVHGGNPITLRVRRRISDLTPDPDDADLAWAQGRQFVTPSVPPADIMWDVAPAVEQTADLAASSGVAAQTPPTPTRIQMKRKPGR